MTSPCFVKALIFSNSLFIALVDRLADLEHQEEALLAEIGTRRKRANSRTAKKWVEGRSNSQYIDPAKANLPFLRGRLENVRSEKERVRRELERAAFRR